MLSSSVRKRPHSGHAMTAQSADTPTRDGADWLVIPINGPLDIYSAPPLRRALTGLIAEGHDLLVIDMLGVTFVDSTGLGILVGALKRLRSREGGELRIVADHDPVLRVMRMTGLYDVFRPYASIADALATAPGMTLPPPEN